MKYLFDLDGTLCTNTWGNYYNAKPFFDCIEYVNKLYEEGHTIKIFTARGMSSGTDWTNLTSIQLEDWGLKFHELIMNTKPSADIIIDDIAINALEWRKNISKTKESVYVDIILDSIQEYHAVKNLCDSYQSVCLNPNNNHDYVRNLLKCDLKNLQDSADFDIIITEKSKLLEFT